MRLVLALVLVLVGCGDHAPVRPGPIPVPDSPETAHLIVYASGSQGDIGWFEVDHATAALTPAGSLKAFGGNPSFLAVTHSARFLYAVSEANDRVGAYAIDRSTGALTFVNDVSSGGNGPAHVSVDADDHFVLVANYGDGTVSVFPIRDNGALGPAQQTLSPGAHAHQIVTDPTNRFAFVPCLGADHVAQYTFDPATGMLAPNAVPHVATAAGAGPRHLAFAPDGTHAYLIDETASTMTALAYDQTSGRLSPLTTVSTLQAPVAGNSGAEVVAADSFVFGSNRGDDSIVTMTATGDTLAPIAWTPSGGMTPRSFAVYGDLVIVANTSGTLVPMTRSTGVPVPSAPAVGFPAPEFVAIVALP